MLAQAELNMLAKREAEVNGGGRKQNVLVV